MGGQTVMKMNIVDPPIGNYKKQSVKFDSGTKTNESKTGA